MKKEFDITSDSVVEGIDFIRTELSRLKVPSKEITKSILSSEEIIYKMLELSDNGRVKVRISSGLVKVSIKFISLGKELSKDFFKEDLFDGQDEEFKEIVSNLLSRIFDENIKLSYKNHANTCEINIWKIKNRNLVYTMMGLVFGTLFGLLLKFCVPEAIAMVISNKILASGSTMFLNALKMIVGPLVLFSMANSIADFTDLKALGRIAIKIMAGYFATSLLAIFVGLFTSKIFPLGDPSLAASVTNAAASTIETSNQVSVSIVDTIVNIVPSSFGAPFLNNDMLQIIFLGVILGMGVAMISGTHPGGQKALRFADVLFSRLTTIIIGFMPVAVFCSMAKMVVGTDIKTLFQMAKWIPACYLGDIIMIACYAVIIIVFSRLNPIIFFKKFSTVMVTAYSLNSSNATMPFSMDCCDKRLGIANRLYSFSIPLGATVNMDGNCVMMVITSMMMARVFDCSIAGATLTTMIVSIIALSLGAPGVPGSSLVCLAILLPQLGMPAEAISLVMGLYSLVGMGMTVVNVTGDAVITTIVAKSERLIDMDVYKNVNV